MPSTTSFSRGAVVLLPFPFSDQSASKVRPAVIAHSPYPSDDLIVVAVSSERGTLRPGECGLRFWREAGLLHPSFLKRAVASISSELVRRQLGILHAEDIAALERALRTWLNL
jgi:mRNA interferase MazF